MATGFVWHELYMWHNTWNWAQVFPPSLTVQPGEHAENPETKRRFRNLLEVCGLLDQLVTDQAALRDRGRDRPLPHAATTSPASRR